ncbi:MAG: phosphoribosylglycinamide formyltransferase [bacterium]
MTERLPRIAVLVSGGGTNLQALIDAAARGRLGVEITVVVSDRPGTRAAERAAAAGIYTVVLDRKSLGGELSEAILEAIGTDLDLVVLAGFLSRVTHPLLSAYEGRIINIHPALLPSFGGHGMYGRRVHEAVIAAGAEETGCTVHYVDEGMDTGKVVLQKRMEVRPDDTPDTLAQRLRPLEHEALIEAVEALTKGEPVT